MNNDFVITGEGSFDEQTLEGKAVKQIIDMCMAREKNIAILCGINKVRPEVM